MTHPSGAGATSWKAHLPGSDCPQHRPVQMQSTTWRCASSPDCTTPEREAASAHARSIMAYRSYSPRIESFISPLGCDTAFPEVGWL